MSGPTEAQDTFCINDRSKLGRSCRKMESIRLVCKNGQQPMGLLSELVLGRTGGWGGSGAALLVIEEKSESGVHSYVELSHFKNADSCSKLNFK